jgi:predicted DNA-binding transcriptional regulator AlpA
MQLLKQNHVLSMLNIGRSTLFEWRNDPEWAFPKPVCEAPLLWFDEDIHAFILRLAGLARVDMPELDHAMSRMAAQGRGTGQETGAV